MTVFTIREIIILFGGGGIFLGIFIGFVITLYLYYTKMDEMLGYFKNSPSVTAPLKHSGLMGKMRAVSNIASLLTFPGLRKYSSVSEEDIDNFPPLLRRKLVILYRAMLVLLFAMLIFGAAVKLDFI